MKQSKRKFIAILAMATMCVTALSSGIIGLKLPAGKAVAATVPERPAVTYIEDVVNERNDMRYIMPYDKGQTNGQGYFDGSTYKGGEWNTLNTFPSGDYTVQWGAYDGVAPNVLDTVYYYNYNEQYLSQTNLNTNGNIIEGNFSYYGNAYNTADPTKGAALNPTIVRVQNITDKDAILSLKVNWTGKPISFLMRNTIGDSRYLYLSDGRTAGKYRAFLNHSSTQFIGFAETTGDYLAGSWIEYSSKNGIVNNFINRYPEVLTEEERATYDSTNAVQYFDRMLSMNDVLTITYGAYDADTDGDGVNDRTLLYLKYWNETKGKLIHEQTKYTALDTTDYTKYTPRMAIALHHRQNYNVGMSYDRTPVWIGGVNEPLITPSADTTMTAMRGTKLSDLELPQGYALADGVDGNQTIAVGENTIQATCAFANLGLKNADGNVATSYFGTTSMPCTITVTGEQPTPCVITIKDVNGNVIGTDTASIGEEYTIPALSRDKTFVAYKVGDTLMNVGDTFVPETTTLEVTLLETDFALREEVSVRMAQTEKGYGGIRWTSQMNTADFENINGVVQWTATVAPSDAPEQTIVKTFTAQDLVTDGDYTVAYCTITNIQRHNYNRSFTATVKLTITYTDGDTVDVAVDSQTACVYDLAVDAYGKHLRQQTIDSVGLYNSANVAILQQYINGVIDLDCNAGVLSVSEADGLDMAKEYVLVNENGEEISQVEASEDGGVYTATLRFKMNDAAPNLDDNVPVILRNGASWSRVSANDMTRVYDAESNILTLTLTWVNA